MTEERWPLPDGWKWVRAGDVGKIVGGGTPPASDPANFTDDGGVAWITPADLTDYTDTYIGYGRRNLSKKGFASCGATLMPAGTVLYSSRAPIGYCAIASDPISTNQGFKSIVPNDGIVPEFLRYYLLSSKEYAEGLASGTTFKELSGARMSTLPIPLASEGEQRRTVAKLDSLLSRSKSAQDKVAHVPQLVERYKQAVLAAAFRGDLTDDWRKRNDATHSADEVHIALLSKRRSEWERREGKRAYKPPIEDYIVPDELPTIPASWKYVPVEHLSTKVVDGVHKKPDYKPDGIPFLTVRNLTAGPGIAFSNVRYVSHEDHEEFSRRANPTAGDILITKDGTLGVTRAIRSEKVFSIFVSLALVKPVIKEMTDYLELAFQSPVVPVAARAPGAGGQIARRGRVALVERIGDRGPAVRQNLDAREVARFRFAQRLEALAARHRRRQQPADITRRRYRDAPPVQPSQLFAGHLLSVLRNSRAKTRWSVKRKAGGPEPATTIAATQFRLTTALYRAMTPGQPFSNIER
jgi:type I restriction enzyme, S subunit